MPVSVKKVTSYGTKPTPLNVDKINGTSEINGNNENNAISGNNENNETNDTNVFCYSSRDDNLLLIAAGIFAFISIRSHLLKIAKSFIAPARA